jgi:hypothetical protein
MMSKGRATVPQHLQGNKGDCMAVVMQAINWRMNPWAVGQKTHVVNGQLGYEAQLVNAVINTMAPTKDRIHYDWFGPWDKILGKFKVLTKKGENGKRDTEFRVPGWSMEEEKGCGVRVWATLKGEDEPRELSLMLEQASVRNSPLWASDPKQQLAYLAVKRWSRLYTPDVILGVYTQDELDESPRMKDLNEPLPKNAKPADIAARRRNAEPAGPSEELLTAARTAADKGRESFAEFWKGIKPADRGALRNEINDLNDRVTKAENNRTIDMDEQRTQKAAPAAEPVQDDFVKGMDRASGKSDGEYIPE